MPATSAQVHPGCTSVTLHAQQHLIPDPEHVREALARPGAAGSISSTRRSSPPRNGSETSRATAPERTLRATWAELAARHASGLERLLLHARRSHGAGPDPRGGRRCWPSGACWSSGSICTITSGSDGWADPTVIWQTQRAAAALRLVVLVPGPRRLAPTCLARLPGDPGAVHGGAIQPGDRGAGLGHHRLDGPTRADRAVRIRPDPLDPGALPGGDVRQRPGRLARSFPAAVARRTSRGPIAETAGSTGGRRVTARRARRSAARRSRPTWPSG